MYWARTCIWLWLATDTRTSPSLLKRGPHASAIKLSGVGFTNPRNQTPAKNANARPATNRPSTRSFGSHSLWLRHLSRGNHRRHGTVLVRRLLNDKMRAVATLEEIDADRRVRQLFGVQLFQFYSQGVGPVSDSRIFGSRVILRAPKRFYGNPVLGNLFTSALNLHRADVPQECPQLFGAHKSAALED